MAMRQYNQVIAQKRGLKEEFVSMQTVAMMSVVAMGALMYKVRQMKKQK